MEVAVVLVFGAICGTDGHVLGFAVLHTLLQGAVALAVF